MRSRQRPPCAQRIEPSDQTPLVQPPCRCTQSEPILSPEPKKVLAQLMETHGCLVFWICLGHPLQPDEAEDASQETWKAVWDALTGQLPGPTGPWKAWLCRVARNKAVNRARQRFNFASLDGVEASSPECDPATAVARTEAESELWQRIAELPSVERFLFEARVWDERGWEEIAAATGLPVGTLSSRFHRAVAKLRRTLGEDDRPCVAFAEKSEKSSQGCAEKRPSAD